MSNRQAEEVLRDALDKYSKFADQPTPKPEAGTWTLTAPSGRNWQAESPIRCVAAESKTRVPAHVALGRLARGLEEDAAADNAVVKALREVRAKILTRRLWDDDDQVIVVAILDEKIKEHSA